MQPSEVAPLASPGVRDALEKSASVHPARLTVGTHLPYTGRETHIFSRYGYFTPPGYHYNCNNRLSTVCRMIFTDHSFGRFYVVSVIRAPQFLRRVGAGVGALAFGFLLCWGPLDNCFMKLRAKQKERREKMASA
ncbi:hypothetical protein CSUI_010301 [Cystoisospora suis]|uniref:Transmembrane protein n=1 Tax=Cystoisospora suis TaxID=483139 RepID=A0A2C6KGV5_9APIC|nr:hypothetical protein CSUI_010301 [Cystoisospora suis]